MDPDLLQGPERDRPGIVIVNEWTNCVILSSYILWTIFVGISRFVPSYAASNPRGGVSKLEGILVSTHNGFEEYLQLALLTHPQARRWIHAAEVALARSHKDPKKFGPPRVVGKKKGKTKMFEKTSTNLCLSDSETNLRVLISVYLFHFSIPVLRTHCHTHPFRG